MFTVEGRPGDHISKVAEEAVRLVAQVTAPVLVAFNDITITVRRGMTADDVCSEYSRESERRRQAYLASPEYAESKRKAEAKERQRAAAQADALASAPAQMTLRNADGWAMAVENNSDSYGAAVMRYAETWARVMEGMMARGAMLASCAKEASHLADTEGITGFQYGAAVSTLSHVWVHGEALRAWHEATR